MLFYNDINSEKDDGDNLDVAHNSMVVIPNEVFLLAGNHVDKHQNTITT